jgi:predicted RNase H-like nuclease (RuvC/YqgF family)
MAMAQTTTETAIEQATGQASATDWLEPLEAKVRAAAERIQALKEENAALHQRIEEFEERLTAPSQDDSAARWEEEKREIRERVERLTKTLEDAAGV